MQEANQAAAAPSVDRSIWLMLLPTVLSVVAGSTDVISFLVLGGLFNAHITGNLVILAAHLAAGAEADIALILSVPIFMIVLLATRLLAGGLEAIGLASLRPLLLLQFLLLAGFLIICVASGPRIDPDAGMAILAGMLGVSAMAVQNALVRISLKGAPTTAVMTTNITRLMTDIGEVLVGRDQAGVSEARKRVRHTWPVVVGFAAGCGAGAACEAAVGAWSLAVPVALALVALVMAWVDSVESAAATA